MSRIKAKQIVGVSGDNAVEFPSGIETTKITIEESETPQLLVGTQTPIYSEDLVSIKSNTPFFGNFEAETPYSGSYVGLESAASEFPSFYIQAWGGSNINDDASLWMNGEYLIYRNRGTSENPLPTLYGDLFGSIVVRGRSPDGPYSGGYMSFRQAGAGAGSNVPTEIAFAPNNGTNRSGQTRLILDKDGNILKRQAAPAAFTNAATLTAPDVINGLVTYNSSSNNNLTMPTATVLHNHRPAYQTGDDVGSGWISEGSFDFSIISLGTGAATLTMATGVTSVGSRVVSGNTSGMFRVRKSSNTEFVVYRLA
jgi:hypothetical protein